jgi:mono/diheme cytochrome c family protein
MSRAIGLAIIMVFLLAGASVKADDAKDVRDGRAFAQRVCAICHGIQFGQVSAAAGAPNFYTVATTPGMSPLALRVALESSHRSMPNFAFTADEMRTVIVYILSLQDGGKR